MAHHRFGISPRGDIAVHELRGNPQQADVILISKQYLARTLNLARTDALLVGREVRLQTDDFSRRIHAHAERRLGDEFINAHLRCVALRLGFSVCADSRLSRFQIADAEIAFLRAAHAVGMPRENNVEVG